MKSQPVNKRSMTDINSFYTHPILNSPYMEPRRHWELDENHQPTQKILEYRRPADFITPVPLPKKRAGIQGELMTDMRVKAVSDEDQLYHKALINEIRHHVSQWRKLPRDKWELTSTSADLLEYWRKHEFNAIRPFFCQLEAVETAIWLAEVAGKGRNKAKYGKYLDYLDSANEEHNRGLPRLALKMATGAGKTTVMAMLIAWQTLNAVRSRSDRFSKSFLIVTPGITIRDRLSLLKPEHPDNYYASHELVPPHMLGDMRKAVVLITNFHAFIPRKKLDLSRPAQALISGWQNRRLYNIESDAEIIQRVMPEFTRDKNLVVFNDEAHHCYCGNYKPDLNSEFGNLKGPDKAEAKKEARERNEAAHVWHRGLEKLRERLGIRRIYDMSATPFFLAGSGYAEGTIFPWTMSDFSLMDAIECGIVKLPRIPVSDNLSLDKPMFRQLWEHIRLNMPKKDSPYDPQALPGPMLTALEALYSHYKDTFELWQREGISIPPCFIIVCNNTNASRQVFDYISGYWLKTPDGRRLFQPGKCPLFSNYAPDGSPLVRPNSILIDSAQLERGDLLDEDFREAAKLEIERFKRQAILRGNKLTREMNPGGEPSDAVLLRELINTVGKKGELGEGIRCVVSVGMLSEGWDANNVTHILGLRAFGTQLICEQVIGRALRRQSYELNAESGLFDVEYADALGIPFDFSGSPEISPPQPPKERTWIRAISPERDALEISFPRVEGYRAVPPSRNLAAKFTSDSKLSLTPEMVGATSTRNAGIIGDWTDLDLKNLAQVRDKTVLMHLTKYLLEKYFYDADDQPQLYLYGQIRKIAWDWMQGYLECLNGTCPANLLVRSLADLACERILHAINIHNLADSSISPRFVQVLLDPFNQAGSSRAVSFHTTKRELWATDARKCHINYVVADKGWELDFCRILENKDNHVLAYVKNHGLGFEVPYRFAGKSRKYRPDFIVRIDMGQAEPLNLVVEIKGRREEEDKQKRLAMLSLWLPAVNNNKGFGRWDFLELRSKNKMEDDFKQAVARLRKGLPAMSGESHNG